MEDDNLVCHIKQRYGEYEWSQYYSVTNNTIRKRRGDPPPNAISLSRLYHHLLLLLRQVFLPEGYPHTVSNDYMTYQAWDTLQALCSSINNILAVQGVLKGSGIGNAEATVIAATITWILKSGSGMLGGILFAWARGSHLDCYCKQWRLSADVLNDFAAFVEILAPLVGYEYFIYVMCVAAIAKSIVGVAGGSTRAAVTNHQARCGNIADVSAKDGSQEMIVNFSTLLIGLVMIPLINENLKMIWSFYVILTVTHLYANYRAVGSLKMEFVNLIRLQIVIRGFLSSGTIKSIERANLEEPLFIFFFTRREDYELGAKLMSDKLNRFICLEKGFVIQEKEGKLFISLEDNFKTQGLLESIFYAELLLYSKKHSKLPWKRDYEITAEGKDFQNIFNSFKTKFKASEWDSDTIKVSTSSWRFQQY